MAEVTSTIIKIIIDQLGCPREDVVPDATFESLGADSLDSIEFVMLLEDEFNIPIPDGDAEKLTTVQQTFDYISSRVPA